MICTRCKKHDAIVHTTFESYCEDCALDVSLACYLYADCLTQR